MSRVAQVWLQRLAGYSLRAVPLNWQHTAQQDLDYSGIWCYDSTRVCLDINLLTGVRRPICQHAQSYTLPCPWLAHKEQRGQHTVHHVSVIGPVGPFDWNRG